MGAYVSRTDCSSNYNIQINCSEPQTEPDGRITSMGGITRGDFQADPDIAGIGILAAFIAVTSFAVVLSIISVVWWFAKYVFHWKDRVSEEEKSQRKRQFSLTSLIETLVLSCSDQQVFTGGAYAISLRYFKGCLISVYHYNIVANMMLLTCATHLTAVIISRDYWEYPLVAVLRVIITVGVYLATGVLLSNQNATDERFPTEIPPANSTDSLMFMPAACFQSNSSDFLRTLENSVNSTQSFRNSAFLSAPGNEIHGWSNYLIMLLFYILCVLVEFGRYLRRRDSQGMASRVARKALAPFARVKRFFHAIFGLYFVAGLAIVCWTVIDAALYISSLRSWVHKSGWMQLNDGVNPEEDGTSFGQLVPMLLGTLTIFTFLQVLSERLKVRNRKQEYEAKVQYIQDYAQEQSFSPYKSMLAGDTPVLPSTASAASKTPPAKMRSRASSFSVPRSYHYDKETPPLPGQARSPPQTSSIIEVTGLGIGSDDGGVQKEEVRVAQDQKKRSRSRDARRSESTTRGHRKTGSSSQSTGGM